MSKEEIIENCKLIAESTPFPFATVEEDARNLLCQLIWDAAIEAAAENGRAIPYETLYRGYWDAYVDKQSILDLKFNK